MTQKDKELLLKDLCARLPYGVKFQGEDSNVYTLDAANYFALQVEDMVFKPYLRPMSSMTFEEREEIRDKFFANSDNYDVDSVGEIYIESQPYDSVYTLTLSELSDYFNWLNEHHFDYRGLIEKGLALEAPEGMYKTE